MSPILDFPIISDISSILDSSTISDVQNISGISTNIPQMNQAKQFNAHFDYISCKIRLQYQCFISKVYKLQH